MTRTYVSISVVASSMSSRKSSQQLKYSFGRVLPCLLYGWCHGALDDIKRVSTTVFGTLRLDADGEGYDIDYSLC